MNNSGVPTQSNPMQTVIVVLLVILVGFAGYVVFGIATDGDDTESNDQNTQQEQEGSEQEQEDDEDIDNDEEEQQDEDTQEQDTGGEEEEDNNDEESASTSVVPDGWKEIRNDNYSYTAYRPSSYYYRFFGSQSLLGIDPNTIPEASSYAGAITMQALSGDFTTAMNDYISSYMAIAQTTETQANGEWTLISGTVPETEMMDEQQAISAFIEVDGQTFVVDYRTAPANFSMYEDVFDKFYPAVMFD